MKILALALGGLLWTLSAPVTAYQFWPPVEHGKPHRHVYAHTHWHTHLLEDGTVVHHSHAHKHAYWHWGEDTTEHEKKTRIRDDIRITQPADTEPGPGDETLYDPFLGDHHR